MISEHLTQIEAVIDKYTQASFVQGITYSVERRSREQAYLYGSLLFVDGSSLHFREFLDTFDDMMIKQKYAYHYQDGEGQLIFRYDNATHRPTLSFVEHRHDKEGIIPALSPDLDTVIEEIVAGADWL
ncbi:MAG: hypothetical protein KBG20_13220 [Caldilineaceae bacterium]|nr:hypothetical protein [Caldilineaceae bacterium]MBP8108660.1 hypothetical protein [Caldilineaceae bacterium]MBP8123203.1 hypothetical protein [Caldilineaceae bacterium]MBP9073258.1 hypothetical protein [Caldilineaceae bacterium]